MGSKVKFSQVFLVHSSVFGWVLWDPRLWGVIALQGAVSQRAVHSLLPTNSSLFQFCKQHERETAICESGGGEAGGAGFRFSGVRRNRQRCCRTERVGWGMKEAAERLSKPWAKTFPLLLGNVISQPEQGVMTRCLQMSFGQT